MQLCNGLDGYATRRFIRRRGETTLIRGSGGVDPAGGVMFQPDPQLLRRQRAGDIGIQRTGG